MSVLDKFRPPVTSPKKGRGVLYMMTGDKHCLHLVVSVFALRSFYKGPIAIAAGDEKGDGRGLAAEAHPDHPLGRAHAPDCRPWQRGPVYE
jgi:hypothetical protein